MGSIKNDHKTAKSTQEGKRKNEEKYTKYYVYVCVHVYMLNGSYSYYVSSSLKQKKM